MLHEKVIEYIVLRKYRILNLLCIIEAVFDFLILLFDMFLLCLDLLSAEIGDASDRSRARRITCGRIYRPKYSYFPLDMILSEPDI